MAETIRILIADDHAIVRKGLRTLIASEPGMEVVAEAGDGLEAVRQALALRPDVILMDVVMPRMNGLELASHVRANEQTRHVPIIMVTITISGGRLLGKTWRSITRRLLAPIARPART